MYWFYEIKEGFIVPRTGFEPVTYGLEICWFIEEKIEGMLSTNLLAHSHIHLNVCLKYQ